MKSLTVKFGCLIWCTGIAIFPFETFGQKSEIDSGQLLIETGQRWSDEGEFEQAKSNFEKAELYFLDQSDYERFLSARLERSLSTIWQGRSAEASDLLYDGLDKFEAMEGNAPQYAALILHKFGIGNYLENEYEYAITAFERSLKIREKVLSRPHPDLARSLKNLGICHKYVGNFKMASTYMLQSTDMYREMDDKENLAGCYQELGEIKDLAGDFEEALNYYSFSHATFKELYGKDDWDTGNQEFLIGLIHEQLDKPDLAESHIREAIRVFSKLESPNDLVLCFNALGNISQRLKQDYPDALNHYFSALRLLQSSEGQDISTQADIHNNIGIVYRKMSKYSFAKIHLDSSLYLRKIIYTSPHPRIAHSLDNIGNLFEETGKDYEALQQYQLALENLIPGYHSIDPVETPSIEIGVQTGSRPLLLTILADKANCLYKLALSKNEQEYFDLSLKHFDLADQVIDQMRREYSAEGSKLFWIEKTRSIYEQAISLSLKLDSTYPGNGFMEKAWYFAEKSKSVLLLEGFREIEAKGFAGVPEDLTIKEKHLKNRIIKFETELAENQDESNEAITRIQDSLLLTKRLMEEHISNLERAFPKYFRLKYESDVVGTDELKKLLPRNTLLLEYFIGDHQIYIFALSKLKFACYALPSDPGLDGKVKKIRQAISDKPFFENNYDEAFNNFASGANSIYQSYLGKVLNDFGHSEGRLIIVPDGSLNFIPFEILLASLNEESHSFFGLDYLIHHFSISYSYSGTLLVENMERSKVINSSNSLLAFAPDYIDDPVLLPLPGIRDEVEKIGLVYGTSSIYINGEASKEKFLETHPQFGIIHLATHGWVDPVNEAGAYLAFTHSPERMELSNDLYSYEVPGLDLSAKLVVLSACETGWGKFRPGEGLMSLARSFMFAGTPSVVMSLWKTNDKATQMLMVPFHKYLRSGMKKDEALRKAKLEYINRPLDESGNPYYWAGFISIGDFLAVKTNWLKNNRIYIFIFLITIIILFWKIIGNRAKSSV